MNSLRAVSIAECADMADDDAAFYAAWRHLIDTVRAWTREGFFGRTAPAPIASGDGYDPACEETKPGLALYQQQAIEALQRENQQRAPAARQ